MPPKQRVPRRIDHKFHLAARGPFLDLISALLRPGSQFSVDRKVKDAGLTCSRSIAERSDVDRNALLRQRRNGASTLGPRSEEPRPGATPLGGPPALAAADHQPQATSGSRTATCRRPSRRARPPATTTSRPRAWTKPLPISNVAARHRLPGAARPERRMLPLTPPETDALTSAAARERQLIG